VSEKPLSLSVSYLLLSGFNGGGGGGSPSSASTTHALSLSGAGPAGTTHALSLSRVGPLPAPRMRSPSLVRPLPAARLWSLHVPAGRHSARASSQVLHRPGSPPYACARLPPRVHSAPWRTVGLHPLHYSSTVYTLIIYTQPLRYCSRMYTIIIYTQPPPLLQHSVHTHHIYTTPSITAA